MRYKCPVCGIIVSNGKDQPDTSPRPLCHKCDYTVVMIPYEEWTYEQIMAREG